MFMRIPTYRVTIKLPGDNGVILRVPQDKVEGFMSVLLFNRVPGVMMELETDELNKEPEDAGTD